MFWYVQPIAKQASWEAPELVWIVDTNEKSFSLPSRKDL
jgi:hypothetical protein